MSVVCNNKRFNEEDFIEFGNGLSETNWLLNIGVNVNKQCVFDLYCAKIGVHIPEKVYFYQKTLTIDSLSSVTELQTTFNYFKLVSKTNDVIATIGYSLS